MGKLGEEEEEPATEQRREYTDLGLDLGEREEQVLLLLLLITRPLPRGGGMADNHGAPEAGQLPRVWTRGHRETESRQRVSGVKSP